MNKKCSIKNININILRLINISILLAKKLLSIFKKRISRELLFVCSLKHSIYSKEFSLEKITVTGCWMKTLVYGRCLWFSFSTYRTIKQKSLSFLLWLSTCSSMLWWKLMDLCSVMPSNKTKYNNGIIYHVIVMSRNILHIEK